MSLPPVPTRVAGPDLARETARALREHGVALTGRRVLALCSGGGDSVVLVDVLARLPRGGRPASLDVLFLDHGGRDVSAERRAAHDAAQRAGCLLRERTAAHLADTSADFEARARDWRYGEAVLVAHGLGCDVVATGHSADDQLETLLLGMVGSSGARTLGGMPLARPLADGIELVRPLLGASRARVREHAREHALEYREDPTNDHLAHRRNHLRHEVVPRLLATHPGAGRNIARTQRHLAGARGTEDALAGALLDRLLEEGRLPLAALATVPGPARPPVVAEWLRRAGVGRALTARLVSAVLDIGRVGPGAPPAGARVDLPRGACVLRGQYHLSFTDAPGANEDDHRDD